MADRSLSKNFFWEKALTVRWPTVFGLALFLNSNIIESFPATTFVSGICPQNRKTERAPGRYLEKVNPLPPTKENIERGRKLFSEDAKPTACKLCHGSMGNGNGSLARRMELPPRNFTCQPVVQGLPDGQLFWIIKNGSKGTAMTAHKFSLDQEQIWQLILYIRSFLKI